jgi:hypothetical protein
MHRPGDRLEELDLERSVVYWPGLPQKLIQPRLLNDTPTFRVDAVSMVRPWGGAIDRDAKANGPIRRRGPHHEVEVSSVKAIIHPFA